MEWYKIKFLTISSVGKIYEVLKVTFATFFILVMVALSAFQKIVEDY